MYKIFSNKYTMLNYIKISPFNRREKSNSGFLNRGKSEIRAIGNTLNF